MSPVRRSLLALALGGFGIGTGEFVMLGLLPQVAHGLHQSIPATGYLVSAYALGVVVGAPLVTALTSHLPRKGLLIALALLLATANVISAVMPTFGTVLAMRFVAGLPHGAYFGVATVAAGNLVDVPKRARAMAFILGGLTIANVIGVPATTFAGQHVSWRWIFVGVGAIELLTALAIAVTLPRTTVRGTSNLRAELRGFRTPPLWLALGVATIGGGAMFATFSYIAPMMTHVAGYADSSVTLLMVLFGLGMTAGNLVGARLADQAPIPTIVRALAAEVIVAGLFVATSHEKIAAAATIFAFPFFAMTMFPALQLRIITLGGNAPNLASASIHSAFNIANSIGAALGGLSISLGFGYTAPNVVAVLLALAGLGMVALSVRYDRRVVTTPARIPVAA